VVSSVARLHRILLVSLLGLVLILPWPVLAAGPAVGQVAPPFTVQTLDGTSFDLTEHQGRVVVLTFAAPGCGECVPELRALAQIQAEGAARGVAILALNIDPSISTQDLLDFRASIGGADYAWAQDVGGQVALAYGVSALGTTVIIDRAGRVAYRNEGDATLDQYRAVLAPLLAEPSAAGSGAAGGDLAG